MKVQTFNNFFYTGRIFLFILLFGLIFALFSYYTLLSLSEVHQGFFDFLKALIYNENEGIGFVPKLVLTAKILNISLFFLLTLLSFALFSSGLSLFFYTWLAQKHGYEKINLLKAFKKSFKWQIYRYSYTFFALAAFVMISGLLIISGVFFFDLIVTAVGVNTGLTSFVLNFTGFNMMFFLSLAVLFTLWNGINLCFGTEIAVSEPDLDNKTISLRSKRIIFTKPETFILFFIYCVFGLFLVMQVGSLDLFDKTVFSTFFILNAFSYVMIKYLKTSAYINSLLEYYEKASISA